MAIPLMTMAAMPYFVCPGASDRRTKTAISANDMIIVLVPKTEVCVSETIRERMLLTVQFLLSRARRPNRSMRKTPTLLATVFHAIMIKLILIVRSMLVTPALAVMSVRKYLGRGVS